MFSRKISGCFFVLLITIFSNTVCKYGESCRFSRGQIGKRQVVDKVMANVNGVALLLSDLTRSRIEKDGRAFLECSKFEDASKKDLEAAVDEAIEYELKFQKASVLKLSPTPVEVEKYVASWRESNGLLSISDEEFELKLRSEGITLDQYKEQLYRIISIRNRDQVEMSEKSFVTTGEIEKYCEQNQDYEEEKYLLKTALIPFEKAKTSKSALAFCKKLDKSKEKEIDGTGWVELDWIYAPEILDEMGFVKNMPVGTTSKPIKTPKGFQVIHLMEKEEKRKKTTAERWNEVEKTLKKYKAENFKKDDAVALKRDALIVKRI